MSGPYLSTTNEIITCISHRPVAKADAGGKWWHIYHTLRLSEVMTTWIHNSFQLLIYPLTPTSRLNTLGKEILIGKVDIRNASPIANTYEYPEEIFQENTIHAAYYIDKFLSFGCPITCKIFQLFSPS